MEDETQAPTCSMEDIIEFISESLAKTGKSVVSVDGVEWTVTP